MSRHLLIAAWLLASAFGFWGGDVLAADRWVFCGMAPWQSAIRDAAHRSGIPFAWIEAVIEAESAGCAVTNGKPTTSRAGAMGLMQLMPSTWLKYRSRLRLGDDPFDARDNIMAGAVHLRDLYDRFGAEGFLAAYQAGPERYEESIRNGRPLRARRSITSFVFSATSIETNHGRCASRLSRGQARARSSSRSR